MLRIEFAVMTEYSLLVEGKSALRRKVGSDTRPRADPLMQRDQARKRLLQPGHGVREGKT